MATAVILFSADFLQRFDSVFLFKSRLFGILPASLDQGSKRLQPGFSEGL